MLPAPQTRNREIEPFTLPVIADDDIHLVCWMALVPGAEARGGGAA